MQNIKRQHLNLCIIKIMYLDMLYIFTYCALKQDSSYLHNNPMNNWPALPMSHTAATWLTVCKHVQIPDKT